MKRGQKAADSFSARAFVRPIPGKSLVVLSYPYRHHHVLFVIGHSAAPVFDLQPAIQPQ
jgi:hypothetical protein